MRASHVTESQQDFTEFELGISTQELVLGAWADACNAAGALAGQARNTLLIHTQDLDPRIYDQQPFLDAVSRLARSHDKAHIWILVQDARRAVQEGHRLIELARRLQSSIQLRRPNPDFRDYCQTFLLADEEGYLCRPLFSRYEGTANFNDPAKVGELRNYFMDVWEKSEPDEEMRRLYL
jgi:hypothetical protein